MKLELVIGDTVGPFWEGGHHNERELLASCYRASLALAADNQLTSIAFPAIATGIYGFPLEDACRIAVRTLRADTSSIERAIFCMYSDQDGAVMQKVLDEPV